MVFNSYIFVLVFLPIVIIGYFILNKLKFFKIGELFLLLMSLWFYGYFNVKYLLLILFSIFFNYMMYLLIFKCLNSQQRKVTLSIGLIVNIGLLFYFKYYDFFILNINNIFKTNFNLINLILPLGISFFTFQQISFLIDMYHQSETGVNTYYNLLTYALYVSFFAQLVAGPIVTHDILIPQFLDKTRKHISWKSISEGLYIFSLGMGKKVLLADRFGNIVNWGFANYNNLDTTNLLIVVLFYTFQIYFDFSGYCDMAIGIGKMLNIDLPLNFNSPYKSYTIIEFWRRWHITLNQFFTKYNYIPLGGNRKGKLRTYLNIMIIYVLSGLWHGANWTFILWGAAHGLFCVITRHFNNYFKNLHSALNWMITFIFVYFTWVFFRADSINDAVEIIKQLCALNFGDINSKIVDLLNTEEFVLLFKLLPGEYMIDRYPYLLLVIFIIILFYFILAKKNSYEKMVTFKMSISSSSEIVIILVWSIISFSGVSTFLYFNF